MLLNTMSNDIAIAVNLVSKRYFAYESKASRLCHAFWPKSTGGVNEIWALRDISFEVQKGESVGVIGRNGSGKSTLLEIITGTLKPTTGHIQVNGRVAALLELGSGFNPEYTGRENVFLNGILLGLSRAEVENRFDDIAAFADIGDVLDRPVKTYSSGMLVRLAFAVQVALDPDILIVDEALSVGDYFFQQKCFGRLREMRENGLTLLFVSHDMGTVRDLCANAVYLQQGARVFFGDAKTAICHYFAETESVEIHPLLDKSMGVDILVPNVAPLHQLPSNTLWHAVEDKSVGILAVRTLDAQGNSTTSIRMGEVLQIEVYFKNPEDDRAAVSLDFKNRYNQTVFVTNSQRQNIADCRTGPPWGMIKYELEMNLEAGLYSLNVSLNSSIAANKGKTIDATNWIGPIQINWDYENEVAPFLGMFCLPAKATMSGINRIEVSQK